LAVEVEEQKTGGGGMAGECCLRLPHHVLNNSNNNSNTTSSNCCIFHCRRRRSSRSKFSPVNSLLDLLQKISVAQLQYDQQQLLHFPLLPPPPQQLAPRFATENDCSANVSDCLRLVCAPSAAAAAAADPTAPPTNTATRPTHYFLPPPPPPLHPMSYLSHLQPLPAPPLNLQQQQQPW